MDGADRVGTGTGTLTTVSPRPAAGACPACDGVGVRPLLTLRRDRYRALLPHLPPVRFAVCVSCGLVRQEPRPSSDDLRELYSAGLRAFLGAATPDGAYLRFAERGAAADRATVRRLLPALGAGRVFEIGCATGQLLRLFAAEGWAVSGVEPDAKYAAFGREQYGLDIATGFFEDLVVTDGGSDLVVCMHVLEHVADPRGCLARTRRLLPVGGHVVIRVPNLRQYRVRDRHPDLFERVHLYAFSRNTLAVMLRRAGFAVVGADEGGRHLTVAARAVDGVPPADLSGDSPDRIVAELRRYRAKAFALATVPHVARGALRGLVVGLVGRERARRAYDVVRRALGRPTISEGTSSCT
jgi:SAM-dependent methyltransferase